MSVNNRPSKNSKKNLQQHMKELRLRLLICIISVIFTTTVAMVYSERIYEFFLQPLERAFNQNIEHKFIFTNIAEGFFTQLKVSFITGIFLASPIVLSQIYFFLAPGLYKKERFTILPCLAVSPLLFFAGLAFAYYFVIPQVWQFFLSFERSNADLILRNATIHTPIVLEAKISEYLDAFLDLAIGFAIAFQLPIIIFLLVKGRIINCAQLAKFRKYAVIIIFIVSAILTPPDVLSQILLAMPMLLLYEVSLLICRLCSRSKKTLHKKTKKIASSFSII